MRKKDKITPGASMNGHCYIPIEAHMVTPPTHFLIFLSNQPRECRRLGQQDVQTPSASTDFRNPFRSSLSSKHLHLYSTRPSTLLELGDGGGLNQPMSDLPAARAMISHVLGPPALLVMKGE